ncbi:MAG TPA: SH3 domain-containing protein [Myxococcota bacterium]
MISRTALLSLVGLAALCASAAAARAPELPRELRGRVAIEVTRCRPIGRGDALLEADVRVRANATGVALPGLHCGAYDDDGSPFFLTPVTGRLNLRAEDVQKFSVRFAADATHRECGCTVRDVRPLAREDESREFSGVDAEFDAFVAGLSGEAPAAATEATPAALPEAGATEPQLSAPAPGGSGPAEISQGEPPTDDAAAVAPMLEFAPPALRYERMLAPNVPLRAAASPRAAITGLAQPGTRIAVDRIERGWKLARTPDGLTGWLPSDAATPDIAAPERMAEQLAPLHAALSPSASTSEALCASLERTALGELVAAWRIQERAVYVRPLWYALAPEDRDAFQAWAAACYSTARVMDAMTGREIRSEEWEPPR